MSSPCPLSVLKDELHYNPQLAMQSISRLLAIGRALGPERTRTELLPYLTSEIQQGNLNGEVLHSIAEVLHQLVEFVVTTEDARCLLAPLRELCCAEEANVREQAVHGVRAIGAKLPAAVLSPQLVPMVLSLGAQSDWFTPRVSACGMLPLAVALSLHLDGGGGAHGATGAVGATTPALACSPVLTASIAASPPAPPRLASEFLTVPATPSLPSTAVPSPARDGSFRSETGGAIPPLGSSVESDSPLQSSPAAAGGAASTPMAATDDSGGALVGSAAELVALYTALCADPHVSVRRAAASAMAELAAALGSHARVARHLAVVYARMLSDESDAVRITTLAASAAIAEAGSLSTGDPVNHTIAAPLVTASRDKLPAVRVALAEALPGVARASAAGASLARELATQLIADPEIDVRIAMTLQASAIAAGLGASFVSSTLLPTLDQLVRDESVGARVELASVLMSLARPLGPAGAASRLLPLVLLLLDDSNTNVRLTIIYRFGDFTDVIGIEYPVEALVDMPTLDPALEQGGLLELLRQLGDDQNWRVRHAVVLLLPSLASQMAPTQFDARFDLEPYAIDPCSLVRLDTIKACATIAALPGYGNAWVDKAVLPMLRARHADRQSYQRRAVLLEALAVLAGHMSVESFEGELLPLALSMADDRVPNLRLILANALQRAAPQLSTPTLAGRVVPALEALTLDEDMDVLGAAREALEVCLALQFSKP
jgi:serine/threonine-protein phosphatase 2A regulatory subunit A